MIERLTVIEQRVLGVLLEKERTVPDTYPMTLNGVTTGCNQSSGRDPVMTVTDIEVTGALGSLRERGLTRRVLPSHGARTEKYRQVADEVWGLDDGERAVLTLLLLRGPQTPGELRSRSGRLHEFPDLEAVHAALDALAARGEPFVLQLERQPGRKERRWMHLLTSDDPAVGGDAAETAMHSVGAEPATDVASEMAGVSGVDSGPAPPRDAPVPSLHPDAEHLAPLLGTWEGSGIGNYPTIEPFEYHQTIQFSAVAGKPLLAYRSTTTAADDGRPLHAEVGWLRAVGGRASGGVELVIAQAPGLVEAAEGVAEVDEKNCTIVMSSTVTAGTSTAKSLDATEREYQVDGDELSCRLAMSAVGQTLQRHLTATLRRAG